MICHIGDLRPEHQRDIGGKRAQCTLHPLVERITVKPVSGVQPRGADRSLRAGPKDIDDRRAEQVRHLSHRW